MSAFGITPASTSIPLDASGQGVGSFTVSNETNHPIRVSTSVTVTSVPPPPKEWLLGPDRPDRDLAVNGADQFTVSVRVPAGSAGGTYGFRLDAVSVELPDEEWAHGPEVTFVVPEPPPPPPPPPPPRVVVQKGYVETVIGALAGGFGAGIGAGLLGGLLLFIGGKLSDNPVGVILILLGALMILVGPWAGTAVGAYLFLQSRAFPEPWRTAVPIAVFFPIWFLILLVVTVSVTSSLNINPPGPVVVVGAMLGFLIDFVVPALAGRALYRFRTTGGL